MSYRKKVDAQHAHIGSLRLVIGLLLFLCLYMAYGWQSAPSELTVHVPPDLRSGSTRHWWDVPPESVYAFGLYIFQQMNRWPSNGEVDYEDNIARLATYLTPSCKTYLQNDFELRRNTGELRRRERGVFEIPGRGINDPSTVNVEQRSINDWTVNLDITADEHLGGERVKRAFARYPLHIVRSDVDPETNPFGLAWNCYAGNPQRIEASETPTPEGGI
ncbi:integrating conjugative element protein, PFL_4703 family [Pseudomonas gessardii]|uniref:TIGR03746 family integrating conjugative element protein n=1 Tax=Pseudomonas gessardii TaxID=78544 RepID=A0A7Y1MVP3_9PSED|nr:TIGR03746 family integrating conjugative element protein [Pseudomonas gessardii]MRU50126.1 TIGR03746 family integrating conjugative element protein [Pseudomonas gessardii]NNA98902.1 TIGR03746 family integrating conjugative element protein [Pseudomonas gessardii]ONH46326.1 integrating conjugative element protein [Pseudomonas gessardii]SDR33644.1 integrating conjugative element protein, PFL_4703 family [Pseudomonas gessardii]